MIIMSNYEKQNFQSGQILTAAQLNHIEEGIEKILPAIEAGTEKQLVSDSDGNLMWIDTTHGFTTEEVIILEDYALTVGGIAITISSPWDENSKMSFYIDGKQIFPSSTSTNGGMFFYYFEENIMIIFQNRTTLRLNVLTNSSVIGKKLTIKSLNYNYNKINPNFLPINSIAGEGMFSTVLNNNGQGKATNNNATSANTGIASGINSFAIGGSEAKGNYSFSAGAQTLANGYAQTVFGMYNIPDKENVPTSETYAMIVGNGGYDESVGDYVSSNAHTLDWNGNAWFAGDVEGNSMIVKSSTEGSNKRFKITVDDSGTISATEMEV